MHNTNDSCAELYALRGNEWAYPWILRRVTSIVFMVILSSTVHGNFWECFADLNADVSLEHVLVGSVPDACFTCTWLSLSCATVFACRYYVCGHLCCSSSNSVDATDRTEFMLRYELVPLYNDILLLLLLLLLLMLCVVLCNFYVFCNRSCSLSAKARKAIEDW